MSLLKSARSAIDRKDYEEGLRLSTEVLSSDPENYNAHIFRGLCLDNLNRSQEGIQAYSQALSLCNTKGLAYQGLFTIYEKRLKAGSDLENDSKSLGALKIAFAGLQVDKNDEEGAFGSLSRALELLKDHPSEALRAFKDRTSLSFHKAQSLKEYALFLVRHENDVSGPELECLDGLLEEVLSLEEPKPSLELLRAILSHKKDNPDLAHRSIDLYPEDPLGYEVIFEGFLKSIALHGKLLPSANLESIEEDLLKPYGALPGQRTKLMTSLRGGMAFLKHEYNSVLSSKESNNEFDRLIRLRCLLSSGDYLGALRTSSQGLSLDRKVAACAQNLKAKTLYYAYRWDEMDVSSLEGCEELKGILENVKAFRKVSPDLATGGGLASGIYAYATGSSDVSRSLLEPFLSSSFEAGILLGLLHFDSGAFVKARDCFLRSLKLNPGVALPYTYLGILYARSGSLERSLKCFERSLKLSPPGDEALIRRMSQTLEDTQGSSLAHARILEGLLRQESSSLSGSLREWISLRLGILHLNVLKGTEAVDRLQPFCGMENRNLNALEALGDAYTLRGSYCSALKIFQEISSQPGPASSLSTFKIAQLHNILGDPATSLTTLHSLPEPQMGTKAYLLYHKGLSETHLRLAEAHFENILDADGTQEASMALSHALKALKTHPNLTCLWKLAVRALLSLCDLSEAILKEHLSLPPEIQPDPSSSSSSLKSHLHDLGSSMSTLGIRSNPSEHSLWHDLGLFSFLSGKRDLALRSLKKALSLFPQGQFYWNTLGLLAFRFSQYELSQHAFIKAVKIQVDFSIAWTNLGILYLTLDQGVLANRAFQEAQDGGNIYAPAWSGQSILAERVGSEETMDILRHAGILGKDPFACFKYGMLICGIVKNKRRDIKINSHEAYVIDKLYGISSATDSLEIFLRRYPDSVPAWSILASLLEGQNRLASAESALYRLKALNKEQITDSEEENISQYLPLARVLHKRGNIKGSIEILESWGSTKSNPDASCLLSLNYYKDNQLKNAYGSYQHTLSLLKDDGPETKADILCALGAIAYRVQGPAAAQTLLSQAKALKVRPYFSLTVLGIRTRNVELILDSLSHLGSTSEESLILRSLVMAFYQKKPAQALNALSKALHLTPESQRLWEALSQLAILFSELPSFKSNLIDNHLLGALLRLKEGESSISGGASRRRTIASKYVHMFPHLPEGRCILLSVLGSQESSAKSVGRCAEKLLERDDGGDDRLGSWLTKKMRVLGMA